VRHFYEFRYDGSRGVLVAVKTLVTPVKGWEPSVAAEITMDSYPELAKVLGYLAEPSSGVLVVRGLRRFFRKLERIARLQGRGMVSLAGTERFVTVNVLERLGVNRRRLEVEVRRLRREVWRRVVLAKVPGGALCRASLPMPYYYPIPRWLERRSFALIDYGEVAVGIFKTAVMVWDWGKMRVEWFGFHPYCGRLATLAELAERLREALKDDVRVSAVLWAFAMAHSQAENPDDALVGLIASLAGGEQG